MLYNPRWKRSSEIYKREDPYAFGLGKRDSYPVKQSKRDPYAFGLGKRAFWYFTKRGVLEAEPKRDQYAFGLGKEAAS